MLLCAFSISSNKTTEYGDFSNASVSTPPSSYPTYPAGAPISLDTVCASEYSLISNLKSFILIISAIVFASSVFPTPDGPTNKNTPIGLFSSPRPDLDIWIHSVTFWMASSWPNTFEPSSASKSATISRSSFSRLFFGTLHTVHTMSEISFSLITLPCSGWMST